MIAGIARGEITIKLHRQCKICFAMKLSSTQQTFDLQGSFPDGILQAVRDLSTRGNFDPPVGWEKRGQGVFVCDLCSVNRRAAFTKDEKFFAQSSIGNFRLFPIFPNNLPNAGDQVMCVREIDVVRLALYNLPTEGHPKVGEVYRVKSSSELNFSFKEEIPCLSLDFDAPLNALGEPMAYSIEYFEHVSWKRKDK